MAPGDRGCKVIGGRGSRFCFRRTAILSGGIDARIRHEQRRRHEPGRKRQSQPESRRGQCRVCPRLRGSQLINNRVARLGLAGFGPKFGPTAVSVDYSARRAGSRCSDRSVVHRSRKRCRSCGSPGSELRSAFWIASCRGTGGDRATAATIAARACGHRNQQHEGNLYPSHLSHQRLFKPRIPF